MGRASMRSTLANVAAMLGATIEACPWHTLRFAHVAALRSLFAERFAPAPATANKYMSAIRQVMRQAWLLGLMDGEEYQRAAAVRNVKGSRLPTGRALEGGKIRALFAACADGTPAGARDAAAFAMMFGMGLCRAEVVGARLADYEADSGTKPPASCTCPTSGTRLDVPARAVWVCAAGGSPTLPGTAYGSPHRRKNFPVGGFRLGNIGAAIAESSECPRSGRCTAKGEKTIIARVVTTLER